MEKIKIKRADFKEVLPFGRSFINERWIRGYDWMVSFDRVEKVPAWPGAWFERMPEEMEKAILSQITEHYRTIYITDDTIGIYDNIEPDKIHTLRIFRGGTGENVKIRERYVHTFGLSELRYNNMIAWTPDEKFLVRYL